MGLNGNKINKLVKEETLYDYRFHNVLYELRKYKSPHGILICTIDIPDEWLIEVVYYNLKTKKNEVTHTYMIIPKQLEFNLKAMEKDGFKIITNK